MVRVIALDKRGRSVQPKHGEYAFLISLPAVLDALRKARRLIVKADNWNRYDMAKDASGRAVDYRDPSAVKFSALGAIWRVCGDSWELQRACNAALDPADGIETHITWINKWEGHTAVIRAFNAAIKRLSLEVEGDACPL